MAKVAVFGLDLEDWYHLDYIKNYNQKTAQFSMLDGFDNYINIFNSYNIKSTLFVVGEIAQNLKIKLRDCSNSNFEIASHSFTHRRPLLISKSDFKEEVVSSKKILEDIVQKKIKGFRAPCFSMNREYLQILIDQNYLYDSSKISFKSHPLYGDLHLNDFEIKQNNIYQLKNFIEFEIPTYKTILSRLPFSGGGYLRLLPFFYIKKILKFYNANYSPLFFYLHPFELSDIKIENIGLNYKNKFRFQVGRNNLKTKLKLIIEFLIKNNWQIITFENLYDTINNQ